MSAVNPARRARSIGDLPQDGMRSGREPVIAASAAPALICGQPSRRRRLAAVRLRCASTHPSPLHRRHRGPRQTNLIRTRRGAAPLPSRDRRRDARRRETAASSPASAARRGTTHGRTAESVRAWGSWPPSGVVPAAPRPRGPRGAAVARDPAQGALAPGAGHVASTVAIIATVARTRSPRSCSPTSSRRPAIGGVFLAGFLAPRASWLLGSIVGLVSAVCYIAS